MEALLSTDRSSVQIVFVVPVAGKAKLAFIVQGQEVHTVEVGATFATRFRVQAITEDAVLLSSPDGEKQIRLPLAPDAGSRPPAGPGVPGRPEGPRP